MSSRPRSAEEIFQNALDLPSDKRADYIKEASDGDLELMHEVEELVRCFETAAGDFLTDSTMLMVSETTPDRIGEYEILRTLGEGGMGRVYLARQTEPIQRQVALKVVRWEVEGPAVLQRFLSERRALARMTSRYIAQVYDAGKTEDNQPYFAMEYIPGDRITTYCNAEELSIDDRISLFQKVCSGVQHAHQRGIIHRDLKPSNVLITEDQGVAVPKIIDFGIAKDTDDGDVRHTKAGRILGTPEYMSPEQSGVGSGEIDTRTDVYALGVMLYELVSGTRPIEFDPLDDLSPVERMRRISETEPAKPSSRAAVRAIARNIEGDLDWIVLKALEKEPDSRYASAAEFTADLERYLNHEPVLARPPSGIYTLRKFARRHRAAAAGAIALVIFLAVFAGSMAIQARRISHQRAIATTEATTADQVTNFLVDLFRQTDPDVNTSGAITAHQILSDGVGRMDELRDLPAVQARLLHTLGVVHMNLGLWAQADSLLRLAESQTRGLLEPNDVLIASIIDTRGSVAFYQTRFSLAENHFLVALKMRERIFGPDSDPTLRSKSNLTLIYHELGKQAEAVRLGQETLDAYRRATDAETRESLTLQHNIAAARYRLGYTTEAESLMAYVATERGLLLGGKHRETMTSINGLAVFRSEHGQLEEAIKLWTDLLPTQESLLGPERFETLQTKSNLASAYENLRQLDKAEPLALDALATSERALGPSHKCTLELLGVMSSIRRDQRRFVEGIEYARTRAERTSQVVDRDHPDVLRAHQNLAVLLRDNGELDEAQEILVDLVTRKRRVLGEKHSSTLRSCSSLGAVFERQSKLEDAERWHRTAYMGRRETLGPTHPSTKGSLRNTIRVLVLQGKDDEARAFARTAIAEQGLDLERLLAHPALQHLTEDPAWAALRRAG